MSDNNPTPDQPQAQPGHHPQPGQQPSAPPPSYQGSPQSTPKRLVRTRDDRWIAGVCGGIARYTGLDANLVRLLVVVGTILGFGSLIIAYIVGWILMPEE